MKSTTSPTARKQWARTVSKALGHSRAHRDLLAELAYRAGDGKVWSYSLKHLAEESEVSKPQVQRGLAIFAAEGLIAIKRHGPKPSEYTVNFEIDITQRVITMITQELQIRI